MRTRFRKSLTSFSTLDVKAKEESVNEMGHWHWLIGIRIGPNLWLKQQQQRLGHLLVFHAFDIIDGASTAGHLRILLLLLRGHLLLLHHHLLLDVIALARLPLAIIMITLVVLASYLLLGARVWLLLLIVLLFNHLHNKLHSSFAFSINVINISSNAR